MHGRSRRSARSLFRSLYRWSAVAGFTVVVLFLRTLYLMPFRRSTGQYRRILEDDGIRVNTYCDKKFGEAWLKNWNSTARALCQPQSTSASSEMTFRSMNDDHMTKASKPHVLCDAANLIVNPKQMVAASCLKLRPNYLCNFGATYNHYLPGAFGLTCKSAPIKLEDFPKDHLQDIMDSMAIIPETAGPDAGEYSRESVPSLLVTREVTEHANVYHTLTDLLNVYISLRMLGLESHSRQVLLMDRHSPGPLDALWPAVAAGAGAAALNTSIDTGRTGGSGTARRLHLLEKSLFHKAVFVPPGYTSLLYAHGYEDNSCPYNTALFKGFRRWFLGTLDIPVQRSSRTGLPVRVTFISRKPYGKKKRLTRQISNEDEVFARVQSLQDVQARKVDLASISLAEQIQLLATGTDILVGMHGAALAWSLLMPPGAALLELWPQPGMWRLYEHTAEWAGLSYRRWVSENKVPLRTHAPPTLVDVAAVAALLTSMVTELKKS